MAVAYLYHADYSLHVTSPSHPESVARLESIQEHMAPYRERLLLLKPLVADVCWLEAVHDHRLLERVHFYCDMAKSLDADTETSFQSYHAALRAAGAGLAAVDAFVRGDAHSAFAAVRPPGHHATATQSMGFCLFNNVAITARYAQAQGFQRVLIVDFDVHHGNGSQEIFYEDGEVFYFSSHQYPAYPGSGAANEKGKGAGEGATLNFPLPPGSGDEDILPIYRERLVEVVEAFAPDILLVSAGYDLHALDPLASLRVSTAGVAGIVEAIMTSCDKPKLFMLEGGYHLEALGDCVAETLRIMLEHDG